MVVHLCRGSAVVGSSLGELTLDKLRPSHVEGWVVGLRRKGLAESTIRSAYTILRAVLDTAVRDGALGINAAAAIRRPKVTSGEAAHLTPPQIAALLEAAEPSRYAALFAILVHTGLRRGEALALRWPDVDFERGTLRVRGTLSRIDGELLVTEPKNGEVQALRADVHRGRASSAGPAYRAGPGAAAGRLGVAPDRSRVHHRARGALRSAQRAARPQGRRREGRASRRGLHTLRHSAASVMLTHGVPLKVVSDILGHSSIAITGDVYGHVSPAVSREAVATLGAILSQ